MATEARFAVLGALLLGTTASACAEVLDFRAASLEPSVSEAGAPGLVDAEEADTDASDAEPQTPCERYCRTVMEACSDDDESNYAVYDSTFTCERQCEFFELGEPGDESGNTLNCRLTQAELALRFPGERLTACPAAGPGGDGICGSNCEGFCTVMQAECSEYESDDACLGACAEVPDVGGFDTSIIEGDSLQCRLYHLNAALVSPLNHCPHAAGAYPCADEDE